MRALILVLTVLCAHTTAIGCSCPEITFEEQIARADVVIVGRIVSNDDAVSPEDRFYDGALVENALLEAFANKQEATR